jgi:sugar phosphate isomerase/epimerase
MQMDPLAVIASLRDAIYHVHLKDTEIVADQVALAGVLDSRPFDDPAQRSWVFRAVGSVRGADYWSAFIAALRAVGYDDVLSIENEDVSLPPEEAVAKTASFIRPLLEA